MPNISKNIFCHSSINRSKFVYQNLVTYSRSYTKLSYFGKIGKIYLLNLEVVFFNFIMLPNILNPNVCALKEDICRRLISFKKQMNENRLN